MKSFLKATWLPTLVFVSAASLAAQFPQLSWDGKSRLILPAAAMVVVPGLWAVILPDRNTALLRSTVAGSLSGLMIAFMAIVAYAWPFRVTSGADGFGYLVLAFSFLIMAPSATFAGSILGFLIALANARVDSIQGQAPDEQPPTDADDFRRLTRIAGISGAVAGAVVLLLLLGAALTRTEAADPIGTLVLGFGIALTTAAIMSVATLAFLLLIFGVKTVIAIVTQRPRRSV